jgi:exonuclease III
MQETIYQYSISDYPTCESDWIDCNESVYKQLVGYGETRIIQREVDLNDWDKLWDEYTLSPEYKQSITALQVRAYVDWLKNNFQAPIKK